MTKNHCDLKKFLRDETFAEHLSIPEPLGKNCLATVTIPVRDEAAGIRQTLEALLLQTDFQGRPFGFEKFEIIIFANNCTDNSVEIIENFRRRHREMQIFVAERDVPTSNANIGYVRRLLFHEAFYRHACGGRPHGILLTTDADTITDKFWLAGNIAEIAKGADAVGGRILMTNHELGSMNEGTRRLHLQDENYRLKIAALEGICDPVPHDLPPRHHQHFNGSFAVTAQALARAGGVPRVRFLEDCALFDALWRIDAKFRHAPNVRVYTSARHQGRSEVGLSFQLSKWFEIAENAAQFYVDAPCRLLERFTLRRALRQIYYLSESQISESLTDSAARHSTRNLPFSSEEIIKMRDDSPTFGIFSGMVSHRLDEENGSADQVSLDEAFAQLAEIEKQIALSELLPDI